VYKLALHPDGRLTVFKIGDFSKMSRVSVKTLRYYDEVGLIAPASVDEFTGYRYYSADQLPRLNRILALKDLGFSLEQIARLLDGGLPANHIGEMLDLRKREIREQIEADQVMLDLIEGRLKQIEREGNMPVHDVVIKSIEPDMIASVRSIIPSYDYCGQLFGELMGYLMSHRVQFSWPPMGLFYYTEYKEQDVDVEVAMPVDPSTRGSDRIKVHELPGIETAACLIHKGDYYLFPESYEALMLWIQSNGYRIAGTDRQIYLRSYGDTQDMSDFLTEIQFPVVKAMEVENER